jgi:uncharacterized protein YlxW (UPF0749 family)
MKKDLFEAFEVLDAKVDGLEKSVESVKNVEDKVDKVLEKRLADLKLIVYFNLIVSIVLLFFVIGWLARAFGF